MPSHEPCSCDPGLKILVALDLLACRRILQQRGELLRPLFPRPQREERAPLMLHRRVRILVRRDVQPTRAGRLDLRDVAADRAPVLLAANLEMKEVDRQLRFLGDANREVQLLVLLHALAADVRHVDAIRGGDGLRQLDHFLRMRRTAALESRDQSPRPLAHRAKRQLLHPLQLRGVRRPRAVAHDDETYLVVGHLRDDVHRDALLPERAPVAGEVGPGVLRVRQAVTRRHRRALADDVHGHALPHLALGVAVVQQRLIGMGVEIDEAGGHDETACVDLPGRARVGQPPDGRNAVAADRDVGVERRIARAVDNLPAADEEVIGRLLRARRQGGERDASE